MEPGHEDREYEAAGVSKQRELMPQWSPVMKTGNTSSWCGSTPRLACLNGARS